MDCDTYYENTKISYKTLNIFEEIYETAKEEIITQLQKNIKEKYNIDINTNGTTTCDNITTYNKNNDI
jgi:transcriptional regulator